MKNVSILPSNDKLWMKAPILGRLNVKTTRSGIGKRKHVFTAADFPRVVKGCSECRKILLFTLIRTRKSPAAEFMVGISRKGFCKQWRTHFESNLWNPECPIITGMIFRKFPATPFFSKVFSYLKNVFRCNSHSPGNFFHSPSTFLIEIPDAWNPV